MKMIVTILLLVLVQVTAAVADTFSVFNTADSGVGSLRQAMLDANANPGADIIAFGIPNGGGRCDDYSTQFTTHHHRGRNHRWLHSVFHLGKHAGRRQ